MNISREVVQRTEPGDEIPTRAYGVLLEKMTPVYTLVMVMAANEEDAVDAALEDAEDFGHDRLPGEGVWSIIPSVDILMPTEDGGPKVIGVCEGDLDPAKLACVGSNLVTSGGIIAPHFVYLEISDTEGT